MVKPIRDKVYYKQSEIQELYAISGSSLRRYVADGKLTDHRTPGGHRRYNIIEVDVLLAKLRLKNESKT